MASNIRQAVRLFSIFAACGAASLAAEAQAQAHRVDLRILVVSTGDSGTAMVKASLDEGLVPYTELNLSDAARPQISDAFLIDTTQPNLRRGRFQAVVLPNDAPDGLSPEERDALHRYEREFKVRQLDTYVYPSAAVGLSAPVGGGTLDGATATITEAGRAGPFSYLQGTVPFEDLDPATFETYAYVATPAPAPGATYTPLVEATLPGSTARGAILGVHAVDGREELIFTAAVNQYQTAQKILFPGILNWLTYGVHLGQQRMAFSLQVDGVFRENGRWSDTLHCTLNESCPGGEQGKRILMTPADVDALVAWQERQGMKLDLAFHGSAYLDRFGDAEANALGRRLLINRALLRWVNQTYAAERLDCLKSLSGGCAIGPSGATEWPPYQIVQAAITKNIEFAARAGIRIDPTELITAGYTGLARPPSDPSDNPDLVRVLSDLRIGWVATDGVREREQRALGADARSVPRYSTNVFPNAATKAEEIAQYNWIYASSADGGSGTCEANGTCIPAAPAGTGYESTILPREVRTVLLRVLSNDPRPHHVAQSNLAEERLAYPLADGVLAAYRAVFNGRAPLANPTLREAGSELKNRADWQTARARVEAYVQNGALVVSATGAAATVPLTVASSAATAGLTDYWGVRAGWSSAAPGRALQVPLEASVGYAR